VVDGTLRFDREVKLLVSDAAKIGPVEGATVQLFTGDDQNQLIEPVAAGAPPAAEPGARPAEKVAEKPAGDKSVAKPTTAPPAGAAQKP
jgi:hypothetical protein